MDIIFKGNSIKVGVPCSWGSFLGKISSAGLYSKELIDFHPR